MEGRAGHREASRSTMNALCMGADFFGLAGSLDEDDLYG